MPTVAQARMPDTARMGGRRRGYRLERWFHMPVRCRRRQAFAAVLLFLAGTFSLRGWRAAMMISSNLSQAEDVGRWWATGLSDRGGKASQCEWQHNGPILYSLLRPDPDQDGKRRVEPNRECLLQITTIFGANPYHALVQSPRFRRSFCWSL